MASFSYGDAETQAVIAFVFINLLTFIVMLFFNSPAPNKLSNLMKSI